MPKPTIKQKLPVGQKPKLMQQKMPLPPQNVGPGQDKLCYAIAAGILVLGLTLTGVGLFYANSSLVFALTHKPLNWVLAIGMGVVTILCVMMMRFVVWAAFFAAAMFAARTQSWQAQEKICRMVIKYRIIMPGGASWAVQALLQQMLHQGLYKEVIALGGQEYDVAVKKNPGDQNMALLCACVGLAHQMQNDSHGSILWNERAVELFAKVKAALTKSGPMQKMADRSMIDGIYMQYVGAHANLGTSYFNVGNNGKAKKNFGCALDEAAHLPDSPEKQNIIRAVKEHLSRLKHW